MRGRCTAIAALRSGHLLDELFDAAPNAPRVDWRRNVVIQDGRCSACGKQVEDHLEGRDCVQEESRWLRILHRLLDCDAASTPAGVNSRPQAWVTFRAAMQELCTPHPAYAAFVTNMLHALEQPNDRRAARERFLSFLACPTHTGEPPASLRQRLIAVTGRFLCGDPNPVHLNAAPVEGVVADAPGG